MSAVVALNLKRLAVGSILLYQRFAPEKLRASCRFTPSCSEYTLLAIEKYGVIKGVGKGIKRIRRCHPPNGGVDLP
ncbi:MAG: membrane protein insertion efficiency factor YidD [Clostridia bacterium]|nr:membrane protein insertion efficiency factor YidD [Clostridia bacterium]